MEKGRGISRAPTPRVRKGSFTSLSGDDSPIITQNIVNFIAYSLVLSFFTMLNISLAINYSKNINYNVPSIEGLYGNHITDTIGYLVIPIALNHIHGSIKSFMNIRDIQYYQLKAYFKVTICLVALFSPYAIYNLVRITPSPSTVTLYFFSLMSRPMGVMYALSTSITRSNHKIRSIWILLPLYVLFCASHYFYVAVSEQGVTTNVYYGIAALVFSGYLYVLADALFSKLAGINTDRKWRPHEKFIVESVFAYYVGYFIVWLYTLVYDTSVHTVSFGSGKYLRLISLATLGCSVAVNCLNFDLFTSLTYMKNDNNDKVNEFVTIQALVKKLERETNNNAALIHRLLPPSVAKELCAGKPVIPEYFDNSSIFFSDIEGFTTIASTVTPLEVINFLNHMYTAMDYIASLFTLYKVETIGDAYVIAAGIPDKFEDHALEIANFALLVMHCINVIKNPANTDKPIRLRIGINTGSSVCGVVGSTMPRYCIFGDTINTAARMETTGIVDRIHVSTEFALLLQKQYPDWFLIEKRGEIDIKGKGTMTTYWINGVGPANTKLTTSLMAKTRSKVKRILRQQKNKPLAYKHLLSPANNTETSASDRLVTLGVKKLSKLNLLLVDLDNELGSISSPPKSSPQKSPLHLKSLISPISTNEASSFFDDWVDTENTENPDTCTDSSGESDEDVGGSSTSSARERMGRVQYGKWYVIVYSFKRCDLLTRSLTHSLTYLLTYSLILTHSLTHSLTYLLTYLLTH